MMRSMVGSSLIVLASCAAFAQTAASPLSFEVASLKPAANPGSDGKIMRRLAGGPGTTDPGTFTYSNVTVKLLATMAYNLKDYQVEGPDWIDSVGFDLIAKMPPGTTGQQAAQMMQTLLAERFKLVFHRETKPMPEPAPSPAERAPSGSRRPTRVGCRADRGGGPAPRCRRCRERRSARAPRAPSAAEPSRARRARRDDLRYDQWKRSER